MSPADKFEEYQKRANRFAKVPMGSTCVCGFKIQHVPGFLRHLYRCMILMKPIKYER